MKNAHKQQFLAVDPATKGYPRNAKGQFGDWQDGSCFSSCQAEWHKLDGRYSSIHAQLGIVELEDGTWLGGLAIWDGRHPNRAAALRAAVQEVLDRVTWLAHPFENGSYVFSPHISLDEANVIIEWASGLIGKTPKLIKPDDLPKPPPEWSDLPLFANCQPPAPLLEKGSTHDGESR